MVRIQYRPHFKIKELGYNMDVLRIFKVSFTIVVHIKPQT